MKNPSLVLAAAVAGMIGHADVAVATCVQVGKVNRLHLGTAGGNFVEIISRSDFPQFVTSYEVSGNSLGAFYIILATALEDNSRVEVTGDAVSCPTTGPFRSGGKLLEVDIRRKD
jgi:hypothetical protein